jgi:peptidoglycan L-alanyl-D-glutamate endopeptidase CwlK
MKGVHPDLIRVLSRAMGLQIMDFTIIAGVRTDEQQEALYAQGRTKPGPIVTWTLNSLHKKQKDNYGHAVDLAPYPIDWGNSLRFARLAGIIQACAEIEGVDIEAGIEWKNRDMPHFQLRRK